MMKISMLNLIMDKSGLDFIFDLDGLGIVQIDISE